MIRRFALPPLAALLVCAPAAEATFKGGNGRVAYGRPERASATTVLASPCTAAVATVQPDGRADRLVRECQQTRRQDGGRRLRDPIPTPTWRPDARQLAFDAGRQLALISPTGTGFTALPAVTSDDSRPAFSPSGRRLAFTGGGAIYVYDLGTRRARRVSAAAPTRTGRRRAGSPTSAAAASTRPPPPARRQADGDRQGPGMVGVGQVADLRPRRRHLHGGRER